MKALTTLWKFSRPHTVIGSVISICTLYLVICEQDKFQYLPLLMMALLIGVSTNIFIVGLNQVADVDIDKINKPYLPIPSGALRIEDAKFIVFASLGVSLLLALVISPYLFAIIALSNTIGWAYSMRPLFLKRHHLTAALSISFVRGVMLNAGGFLVFNYIVNRSVEMPANVQILTLFIVNFTIVISWFKDLPDIEGDAKYNIKTFPITYSPKTALIAGSILVIAAYLLTIYVKMVFFINSDIPTFETKALLFGHIVLFALFIANAFSVRIGKRNSVASFYKRIWLFFFAEYLVYVVAYC